MGTLTKTFIVLNLVLSVAFVAATSTVLSKSAYWKNETETLRGDLQDQGKEKNEEIAEFKGRAAELAAVKETLSGEKDKLTAELAASQREAKMLENQIGTLNVQLAESLASAKSLGDDVNLLNASLVDARDELSSVKQQYAEARRSLDAQNTTVVGLSAQVASAELKYKELLDRYNNVVGRLEEFKKYETVVAQTDSELHRRAKRIAGSAEAAEAAPVIRATVTAVDNQFGLVVLNVGSDATPPVKSGYRFLVHRGKDFVATVKVVTVDTNMCATEVVEPVVAGATIQVGDDAVTE